MSRGWKIALVASAVLNLFLIGLVAGGLIVGSRLLLDERVELRRGAQSERLAAAFEALPPERRTLRDLIRSQAAGAAPDLREAGAARREAIRLIAEPQYDAAAVAAS